MCSDKFKLPTTSSFPRVMLKEQFELIANQYVKRNKSLLMNYVTLNTVLRSLGKIKNKSVLDVGCGNGYVCRKFYALGASRIVGIDISPKQIELAKHSANNNKIEYVCGDATDLKNIVKGTFDIVTSISVLNYIEIKKELGTIISNVFDKLNDGGKFVSIVVNPDIVLPSSTKYGRNLISLGVDRTKIADLEEFKIEFFDNAQEKIFETKAINYSRKTYEEFFLKAGFSVKWIQPSISTEGLKEMGKQFWEEFIANPYLVAIEGRKK